jgi:hypothetical protein
MLGLYKRAARNIDFGTEPITWSAASDATVTIEHNLGVVPRNVLLTLALSGQVAYAQVTAITDRSFNVNARTPSAWTGSGTIHWQAIA